MCVCVCVCVCVHYIANTIGSPLSNERFDYFSNFHEYKSESQVLIPAEHLWCDFKCRPWAKNSSPNTNDLYIYIYIYIYIYYTLYCQKYWLYCHVYIYIYIFGTVRNDKAQCKSQAVLLKLLKVFKCHYGSLADVTAFCAIIRLWERVWRGMVVSEWVSIHPYCNPARSKHI